MRSVKAALNGGYEIRIGKGLLRETGASIRSLGCGGKAVIITNPVVRRLYGGVLEESLKKDGFQAVVLEVPDGESQKSLETAGSLYQRLSDFHAERATPILALGGGVIGDLAGFVAATYMRGVPLIQIPTTLLAQVDSSIGGKVAVNHGELKNKVGVFYQPRLVISDILTLKTLSARLRGDGLAEIIKYGVIRDSELFKLIEANVEKLHSLDEGLLEDVIYRSAKIKVEVVEKDEKDLGVRNILNFGHTVGHALETVSDFKLSHGEGVALGMLAAGRLAVKQGMFDAGELKRLTSVIERAGLPVKMPVFDISEVIRAMSHDKKVMAGKVRFVLPRSIGEVEVSDKVSSAMVEKVLREFNEET